MIKIIVIYIYYINNNNNNNNNNILSSNIVQFHYLRLRFSISLSATTVVAFSVA